MKYRFRLIRNVFVIAPLALVRCSESHTPANGADSGSGVGDASSETSSADSGKSKTDASQAVDGSQPFDAGPTLNTWPDSTNTGTPAGLTLKTCPDIITVTDTYDACLFPNGVSVRADNVKITRSKIQGQVDTGDGAQQSGLVISDTTIDCNCMSQGDSDSPAAVVDSNFTLLRVNIMHSAHGVGIGSNVVIQDSYIHDLGGNTNAHKDGIYVGNGTNVVIKHNNIECNDGPLAGCTSAIGLLTDFSDITHFTIDGNLLNTNGSYCFYGSGGPQKPYKASYITFTNNHFGRKDNANCGFYGPVTYFDTSASSTGMVWSGNVWDDTKVDVPPEY